MTITQWNRGARCENTEDSKGRRVFENTDMRHNWENTFILDPKSEVKKLNKKHTSAGIHTWYHELGTERASSQSPSSYSWHTVKLHFLQSSTPHHEYHHPKEDSICSIARTVDYFVCVVFSCVTYVFMIRTLTLSFDLCAKQWFPYITWDYVHRRFAKPRFLHDSSSDMSDLWNRKVLGPLREHVYGGVDLELWRVPSEAERSISP